MIEAVQRYLVYRNSPYDRRPKQIEGTYGLVFILEAAENVSPRRFCWKTVNPARFKLESSDLVTDFQREMRLWLNMPRHHHVLPALGLDFMLPPEQLKTQIQKVPLVRMPYCEQSLATWVEDQAAIPLADRLIVLAQMCNGLKWLYDHGIEGHGDLKPNNILLRDRRNGFDLLGDGFPSKSHPWQARVADLGWANIWLQGGGTCHAWRPYLAPERFEGKFEPEASDVYALGVIACELLSGAHPCGSKTEDVSNWKRTRWEKWAASTDRVVDVSPPVLRDLVVRCLSPDPTKRPHVSEVQQVLCEMLRNTFNFNVALQLEAQDAQARGMCTMTHTPWAMEEMARVDVKELDDSIDTLKAELGVVSESSCADDIAKWLASNRSLQRLLLRRSHSGDLAQAGSLAKQSLDVCLSRNDSVDRR